MIISYETVKYVSIQDSRLGLLRYSLILIILFYVLYIEIYTNGKYLMNASIYGIIRFSLQQPTINNCDPYNEYISCENNFLPLSDLPYCQQSVSSLPSTYPGNIYPCEYYEAINAQYITETSIVMLTRVKTMNQTLICNGRDDDDNTNNTCPHTYEITTPTTEKMMNSYTDINIDNVSQHELQQQQQRQPFYVAQSEAFTVLFDHAVIASKLCTTTSMSHNNNNNNNNDDDDDRDQQYTCSSSSSQYNGRLYTTNIELCQQYISYPDPINRRPNNNNYNTTTTTIKQVPCYIEPNTTNTNLDYFTIDVLLRAAGIHSIDDCINNNNNSNSSSSSSHSDNNKNQCTTYRDSGATIIVNIIWNDFISHHGIVSPYYYYRVHVMNKSYKLSIPYYNTYRYSRTLLIGHGIRIATVISGEFHQFDYMTLFITITTALGLLAVATTVVDYLMIYVLPEKDKYTKAKYETATNNELRVEVSNPLPQLFNPSRNVFNTASSTEDNMNDITGSSLTHIEITDDENNMRDPFLQDDCNVFTK